MTEESVAGRETGRILPKLKVIGPALLLAAVVIGPGSIALATIAGSTYGYQLLWVPVAAIGFMIVYTWMAARIGLVTGRTLFGATRQKFGPTMARLGGIAGFLTILAFQAGNNAGIGFATEALLGLDVRLWAGVFTALAIGFIWLSELYAKIEWLVRVVVGIMLLAFVGTLVIVGFDPGEAARGLVPTFPDVDGVFLSLGIAATTFSIAAAVYISHLMREKEWGPERLRSQALDTFVGLAVLGLISVVIMLTSASVTYGQTGPVFSAEAMASQLEPIAGAGAFYLFTLGFFFASLSSLVVNALIGATLLADGFGGDPSMGGRQVRLWSTTAMLFGFAVVLVAGESPIELLRAAQALAVLAFPLLAFLVLSIARDKDIMGRYANRPWVTVVGVVGYLVVLGIVVNYAREVIEFL